MERFELQRCNMVVIKKHKLSIEDLGVQNLEQNPHKVDSWKIRNEQQNSQIFAGL